MCENVCIARSSYVSIFYEKTIALITRMEKHGENREKLIKHILKAYENHLFVLHKYDISNRDILKRFWWHFFRIYQEEGGRLKLSYFSFWDDSSIFNFSY